MSIEEIYKFCGQYDTTSCIDFKTGSESYNKYGSYIIGTIIYSKSERQKLQENLDKNSGKKSDGNVRLKCNSEKLSPGEIENLENDGFDSSDIFYISSYFPNVENKYESNETRNLPEPLKIEVNSNGADSKKLLLNLYKRQLEDGYRLPPFEKVDMLALEYLQNNENVPIDKMEEFYDENGNMYDEIRRAILRIKFFDDSTSEAEIEEYKDLIGKSVQRRVDSLFKEIDRSTKNTKAYLKENRKNMYSLQGILYFENERLTYEKHPIWIDSERFIHIALGHIKEYQTGDRYVNKTPFQYNYNEIISLIKLVLGSVGDKIEKRFGDSSEGFRMKAYFQGDYYQFHINNDGRLMTFHKI